MYKEQQHSSTEHAYQATKLSFLGAPEEIVEIASNMETASGVNKYGQQILCSPSWQVPTYRCWDFKKIEVMKELLEVKWETSNAFIDYLKQTGQSNISHPIKDMFWGNGSEDLELTCNGANFFSILRMQLRDTKMGHNHNWVLPNKHDRKRSQELKMRDWVLQPLDKNIAIIGDSNLGRIPPFIFDSCQIECYPGAKICNISHLLETYKFPDHMPNHLIINVGINDVISKSNNIVQDMGKLVQIVQKTFLKCQVYFVPVQVHHYHGLFLQSIARKINENASSMEMLPLLDTLKFNVELDKIHWKAHTAKWMVKQWLSHVMVI